MKKCLDAAFPKPRAVDDDIATDPERCACRNVLVLIECDFCVPEALREHFGEMQLVFKNIRLTRDDLGSFMRRFAKEHGIMTIPRRMLVGSFHLEQGLEVTRVYQVIEYTPIPCFRRFSDAVSTARREGDVHPHKAIVADTMKLLGNSGYGKTITNVHRHRDVKYCTEKAASLLVNDRRFRNSTSSSTMRTR